MSATTAVDGAAPIVVGVTGSPCRASVTACGDVVARRDDGSDVVLTWHVAADDRWHSPSTEVSVRQQRIAGTPVVETRLRIPDGDAVQRVWSVPEAGGLTVVEIENESPLPVAVAFAGTQVLTERPPADVPIEGIELPADAIVLPVGHRASVRVAVPHDRARLATPSLPPLAPATAVVRGWTTVVDRASRLVLPDATIGEVVTAARCDLLLAGPVDDRDDPVGFVLDVAELARLGDDPEGWLPEIVEPIARIARVASADVDLALQACQRVAVAAADQRAARDIARIRERRRRSGVARSAMRDQTSFSDVRRGPSLGRFVAQTEQRIADGGALLPSGIPPRWFGSNFEVHDIPTDVDSAVSFAVRWHGERPAVLWEQRGTPLRLTAPAVDPGWSSGKPSGEALWSAPPQPTRIAVSAERDDR